MGTASASIKDEIEPAPAASTARLWRPVSEEFPVCVRSLGAAGYEVAIYLAPSEMPPLPLKSLSGSANASGDLRGRVAGILAASLNSSREFEVAPEMIDAGRNAVESRWIEFTGVSGYRLWGEVLTETFRAMMEARQSMLSGSSKTKA
jgi:hypothetical protein